jgi:outer membrane protein assembly factor BamE
MRISLLFYCGFIGVGFSACSGVKFSEWRFPYMYSVQQGNYITQQQLSQLQLGMSKDQVAFIIGHPVSSYMFNNNQWQYIYQSYANGKLSNNYILNLGFTKNGVLNAVESNGVAFSE